MDIELLQSLPPEQQEAILEFMRELPALDPPEGVVPNFDNPGGKHTLGYVLIIIASVLVAISSFLRLYSRWVVRKFRLEDALFIAALGLFVGYQYVLYRFVIYPGINVHQWNIQVKNLIQVLYFFHLASVFYGITIMLLKVSILLDWLDVFLVPGQRNYMFWISHILIWSNVLFYGIGGIIELFQCTPHEKIYNPLYIGGSCKINMDQQFYASGVINAASDFAILLLPHFVIWKLNLSTTKKIGISLMFAIGIFACACAIIRQIHLVRMLNSEDQVYSLSALGLWCMGELMCGFLIMGIPSLPKVVNNFAVFKSVTSLIRSLTSGTQRSEESGEQKPASWGRPLSRKWQDSWRYIDPDGDGLVTLKTMDAPETTKQGFELTEREERDFSIEARTHGVRNVQPGQAV